VSCQFRTFWAIIPKRPCPFVTGVPGARKLLLHIPALGRAADKARAPGSKRRRDLAGQDLEALTIWASTPGRPQVVAVQQRALVQGQHVLVVALSTTLLVQAWWVPPVQPAAHTGLLSGQARGYTPQHARSSRQKGSAHTIGSRARVSVQHARGSVLREAAAARLQIHRARRLLLHMHRGLPESRWRWGSGAKAYGLGRGQAEGVRGQAECP
jgi:hypothetical protein